MADLLTDFDTGLVTGYVDYIDEKRDFIHIYDSQSRHFVAIDSLVRPVVGQFVEFTPEIPKDGKFKKAVIHRIFLDTAEGAESFGYRDVEVIATYPDKGYCSWKLVAKSVSKDGEVILPIFEIGVEEVSYTTGYMSLSLLQNIERGAKLRIIVFLKRYKGIKQPYVVRAEIVSEIGEKPLGTEQSGFSFGSKFRKCSDLGNLTKREPSLTIALLHENGKKDHLQKRKLDSMKLIIQAIHKDPNVTIEHLCHLTGRSQSTIELHLGYLTSHHLITRQGPDKGGLWHLSNGE